MLKVKELTKKLLEIRKKQEELKELENKLKGELLKTLKLEKVVIDAGDNRVAIFKVKRIRVLDPNSLPDKYKIKVEFLRPDIKKIKAHIDELKNQVEEVEDILIRISSRDE